MYRDNVDVGGVPPCTFTGVVSPKKANATLIVLGRLWWNIALCTHLVESTGAGFAYCSGSGTLSGKSAGRARGSRAGQTHPSLASFLDSLVRAPVEKGVTYYVHVIGFLYLVVI